MEPNDSTNLFKTEPISEDSKQDQLEDSKQDQKDDVQGSASNSDVSNTTNKKKNLRLPKGSTPPIISLDEAAKIITSFYEDTGGEASYDPLSSITGNSAGSSVFIKKVATLRNFGLLIDENRQISLTELGLRIAAPHDPMQRAEALREAFLRNEIFQKVYEKYKGRILPQDEFLTNAFTMFVPKELSKEWMLRFKDSILAAGLIEDRNGKFQVRESVQITNKEKEKPKDELPSTSTKENVAVNQKDEQQLSNNVRTPIPLGRNKLAYIELPSDWESSGLKKLLRLLTLALSDNEQESESILKALQGTDNNQP